MAACWRPQGAGCCASGEGEPPSLKTTGRIRRALGTFDVDWISVSMGIPVTTAAGRGYRPVEKTIQGGKVVTLSAPHKGGWVAAIVRKQ